MRYREDDSMRFWHGLIWGLGFSIALWFVLIWAFMALMHKPNLDPNGNQITPKPGIRWQDNSSYIG